MIIVERGRWGVRASRAVCTMFEDRKRVFVDLLRWNVPVVEDRFEVDGFDDDFASYVIVADARGTHLGSARLLPTTRPHILASLFPKLCDCRPPAGDDILEITRFCLSPRQNAAGRLQTRNQLVTALAIHALASGIRTYTGVAETSWLQQVMRFGWSCRLLGAPSRTECGTLGALAIDIDEDTPALLAANGIWQPLEDQPRAIARAA